MASSLSPLNRVLKDEFARVRARSEVIFGLFAPEAYYLRPIPLRNPIFFYHGHIDAFLWNMVFRQALGRGALDPLLDDLFARGIDPPDEGSVPSLAAHPGREEIAAYKAEVASRLERLFEEIDFSQ